MHLQKSTLILFVCSLSCCMFLCSNDKKAGETERLEQWFSEKWERDCMDSPEFLTTLGRAERKSELNDISEEKVLRDLEKYRQDLKELALFDTSLFDPQSKLSWKLYKTRREENLAFEEFRHYNYPINQMGGVHQNLPAFMINKHTVKNIEDARAYVGRLTAFTRKFQQVIDNLKIRKNKGIVAPRFVFPLAMESCRNVIGDTAVLDSNVLIKDLQKKLASLELADTVHDELIKNAKEAVASHVVPAYQSLMSYLKELEPHAGDTAGIWRLANGDRAYQAMLKRTTTTDLTPEEIFQKGHTEVERIHGEMKKIITQVSFKGDLKAFFTFMLEDKQFYYADTKQDKENMIRDYTAILDTMYTRLPEWFTSVPKAELQVKAVEPFREKASGIAFYNMPAPDGSRPGLFYANTYKVKDMPKYEMEALAFHEGNPGHHLQIALAQEMKGIPEFRKYSWYTAYGEGWALYTEYLGKEMGFYTDPYSDFGRLSMELWRACRLVVDAGIHYKRWTREKAISYLQDNTPSSSSACTKAIERYIVIPSQATAYKIGMLEIQRLREQARSTLGERFDIRKFHDIFLQSGAVPLSIFEERVQEWIGG